MKYFCMVILSFLLSGCSANDLQMFADALETSVQNVERSGSLDRLRAAREQQQREEIHAQQRNQLRENIARGANSARPTASGGGTCPRYTYNDEGQVNGSCSIHPEGGCICGSQ